MLATKPYKRENAVAYARKFAFSQNSQFANFAGIGGNCTNFVSQCIYAGGCQMNYTPTFGWYYISLDDRSPSWSGVEYFYNFMIENTGVGPYGRVASSDELELGDVIQLGREADGYYHTLLVDKLICELGGGDALHRIGSYVRVHSISSDNLH